MSSNILPICALVAALMCSVQASSAAPATDQAASADAAWVVLGVQPPNTRMEINELGMRDGIVEQMKYNFGAYYPVDGYIVVKVKPGVTYGIGASSLMFGKTIFGVRYLPCGKMPTFSADAGKVVYVLSVAYRSSGPTWTGRGARRMEDASYTEKDLEGARDFLKAHHPELSDRLEQGSYDIAPMRGASVLARLCQ